jgi:hypothetical protein
MKKWLLVCSQDATIIHYQTIIESETEPDFWTCYELATAHDCEYFMIGEA